MSLDRSPIALVVQPDESKERVSGRRHKRSISPLRQQLNKWVHAAKWAALRRLNGWNIAAVTQKLGSEPFAPILDRYPDIPLKVVRPYLTVGLPRRNRVGALLGHYEAASRLLSEAALVTSHTDGLELYSTTTDAGTVKVRLAGQAGLHREAEWRLELNLSERPITEMGLAIVPSSVLCTKRE